MEVSIRAATPSDAGRVASLLGELGYPADEAGVRARLGAAGASETTRVWVARADEADEADTDVCGFLCAELVPYFPDGTRLCRITALAVSAASRRAGAGRALVQTAAAFASSRGCSGVEVTTRESRAGAQRFYEGLGFRRTSVRYFLTL